jgi:hypothetical protein
MDLGDPISYLTLAEGTDVFAAGGERVGAVEHVLADSNVDVFDGLVVDGRAGPGGWRFVDAPLVDRLHERGVVLSVDAEAFKRLPEPTDSPATMRADPDDAVPDDFGDKLKRAWDYLSGKY